MKRLVNVGARVFNPANFHVAAAAGGVDHWMVLFEFILLYMVKYSVFLAA